MNPHILRMLKCRLRGTKAAENWDLRIYAKSEDSDQLAHSRSLVRIFTVRLPYRGPVEEIGLVAKVLTRRVAV